MYRYHVPAAAGVEFFKLQYTINNTQYTTSLDQPHFITSQITNHNKIVSSDTLQTMATSMAASNVDDVSVPTDVDADDTVTNLLTSRVKPTYHGTSIWGNVFMQVGTVGLASYHFISPGKCIDDNADDADDDDALHSNSHSGAYVYISYEHHRCSQWGNLDDGKPLPPRMSFEDASYDEETRTFRGTIPWFKKYRTTWNGDASWQYEIVFDSEFLCILSGSITCSSKSSILSNQKRVRVDNYGEHLNYINAAIVERIESRAEVPPPPYDFLAMDVKQKEVRNMLKRLDEEDILPDTKIRLMIAAQGAIHEDHIDYNLSSQSVSEDSDSEHSESEESETDFW